MKKWIQTDFHWKWRKISVLLEKKSEPVLVGAQVYEKSKHMEPKLANRKLGEAWYCRDGNDLLLESEEDAGRLLAQTFKVWLLHSFCMFLHSQNSILFIYLCKENYPKQKQNSNY